MTQLDFDVMNKSLGDEGYKDIKDTTQSLDEEVHLVCFKLSDEEYATNYDFRSKSLLSKLKYIIALPKLRRMIKEVKPDVVHAHYASSYGLLALLACKKYGVSVWGSDIYKFPKRSFIHKFIVKRILKKSSFICER